MPFGIGNKACLSIDAQYLKTILLEALGVLGKRSIGAEVPLTQG